MLCYLLGILDSRILDRTVVLTATWHYSCMYRSSVAWLMWHIRLFVNPRRPCMVMVFHLTVPSSDCCAGLALDGACHGHEHVKIYPAGALHAGSLWASLHARPPARIGQQAPD